MSDRDQVRTYVKTIEALEEQIAELNSDKSEFYKSAKDVGLNVKALRLLITERRKKAKDRVGFEVIENDLIQYESYMLDGSSHVRAREGHDPETGEITEVGSTLGFVPGVAARESREPSSAAHRSNRDDAPKTAAPILDPDIPESLSRYHPQQETV